MAEFLRTTSIASEIENIMVDANKELTLISPYFKIKNIFIERIKDIANNGVKITIIYGKDDLNTEQKNKLADINDIEVYYYENLHAKCYFNEKNMVIASMNLYEYSEKNNREMGILIKKETDPKLYEDATKEAHSIKNQSERKILNPQKNNTTKDYSKSKNNKNNNFKWKKKPKGFCIRCGDKIKLDANRPLCQTCYEKWEVYKNFKYREKYCHFTGEQSNGATTYESPIMNKNWDKAKKFLN